MESDIVKFIALNSMMSLPSENSGHCLALTREEGCYFPGFTEASVWRADRCGDIFLHKMRNETVTPFCLCNFHIDGDAEYQCKTPNLNESYYTLFVHVNLVPWCPN